MWNWPSVNREKVQQEVQEQQRQWSDQSVGRVGHEGETRPHMESYFLLGEERSFVRGLGSLTSAGFLARFSI